MGGAGGFRIRSRKPATRPAVPFLRRRWAGVSSGIVGFSAARLTGDGPWISVREWDWRSKTSQSWLRSVCSTRCGLPLLLCSGGLRIDVLDTRLPTSINATDWSPRHHKMDGMVLSDLRAWLTDTTDTTCLLFMFPSTHYAHLKLQTTQRLRYFHTDTIFRSNSRAQVSPHYDCQDVFRTARVSPLAFPVAAPWFGRLLERL